MGQPPKRRSAQLDSDAEDDADAAQVFTSFGLTQPSPSPSPSVSFSSDKENRTAGAPAKPSAARATPVASAQNGTGASANKRRRLEERDTQSPTVADAARAILEREKSARGNKMYYDPDQPMAARRAVRRGYRDITRELADCRADYLQPDSDGIYNKVVQANELFAQVKQTSDALLDSRFLTQAGDLAARRARETKMGGADAGVDVDDFVSKCAAFMRRGPGARDGHLAPVPTQATRSRRRRATQMSDDSAAEEATDEGEALNWGWLGVKACFPNNVRPPVPGFLLGPLSLQKKRRQMTQRTARAQRRDPADAARPDDVQMRDIDRSENTNLKQLCIDIHQRLANLQSEGGQAVDAELERMADEAGQSVDDLDLSDEEVQSLFHKHKITDKGGICFYRFAFNPQSFGQTVENIFYVSFLIRDGLVALGYDSRGLPTIYLKEKDKKKTQASSNNHQFIHHLDFYTWQKVCKTFEITESLIPHRNITFKEIGSKGWYG